MITSPRPAWRRALYRFRHLIGAVAVLAAFLTVVEVFSPGVPAFALSTNVEAGTILTAQHIEMLRVPRDALPSGYFAEPPIGQQIVIDLPAATVISRHLVTSDSLADRAPPGTLVFPIALADPGSRALAQPGTIVTVVAEDPSVGLVRIVEGVTVIAVFNSTENGIFSTNQQDTSTAIVAVPREQANFVLSTSSSVAIRIAISQ